MATAADPGFGLVAVAHHTLDARNTEEGDDLQALWAGAPAQQLLSALPPKQHLVIQENQKGVNNPTLKGGAL